MRPRSAYSVYCKLCHVQAELSVRRKIGKVESFQGWNFRGLYGYTGTYHYTTKNVELHKACSYEERQFTLFTHFVTIINPRSLHSHGLNFWVELEAWK
jgi:hypothetical protein